MTAGDNVPRRQPGRHRRPEEGDRALHRRQDAAGLGQFLPGRGGQPGRDGDFVHLIQVLLQPLPDFLRRPRPAGFQIDGMVVLGQAATGLGRLLLTLLTGRQPLPQLGFCRRGLLHLPLQFGHLRTLRALLLAGRQFGPPLGRDLLGVGHGLVRPGGLACQRQAGARTKSCWTWNKSGE